MIGININIVEAAIKDSTYDFKEKNKEIISELKEFRTNNAFLNKANAEYLNLVIKEFETSNFITLPLYELELLKNKIGEVPTCKRRFNGRKKATYLKDEILSILNYNDKRKSLYPGIFNKIGIKACVYCNAQLTVSTEKFIVRKKSLVSKIQAKFQLDHFYSKDKYPHLSIAIFNLYPVCSPCNLAKGNDRSVTFKLYSEQIVSSDFKFILDPVSKANFLTTYNIKDLHIDFKNVNDSSYQDVFKINELYKSQYDIAEEIFLRSRAFNKANRESLKNSFGSHIISDGLINRFILGNYTDEEEIHKRPLAKFMQDIGIEAGLM